MKEREIIGLAIYKKEQWDLLRATANDRKELEDTWAEWLDNINRTRNMLNEYGIETCDIDVDVDELNDYCKQIREKNNSESRGAYVAELLEKRFKRK